VFSAVVDTERELIASEGVLRCAVFGCGRTECRYVTYLTYLHSVETL
jgi:hypothetical protein